MKHVFVCIQFPIANETMIFATYLLPQIGTSSTSVFRHFFEVSFPVFFLVDHVFSSAGITAKAS